MALQFAVRPKTIVLCDYDLGGFRPPEMVKRRPAVVLVGALPKRGTPSDPDVRYHCRIILAQPLPAPFDETVWWVKADMVATVGFDRLDLFRTGRDQYGKRKYMTDLRVSDEHFGLIRQTVRNALNLQA